MNFKYTKDNQIANIRNKYNKKLIALYVMHKDFTSSFNLRESFEN